MRMKKWTARVDGQDLTFTLRDVGPGLATEYLERNIRNRGVKKSLVESLTVDMSENAFRFNGDTVRFDTDGTLIDGQHRLRAIVTSGATVPMLIVEGLEPTVMDTVDQGVSRTVLDILSTHSVSAANMSVVASTAAILVLGDRTLSKRTRDRKLVAAFVEKNIDLLDETSAWAKRVSSVSPRAEAGLSSKQKCLSPSPLAALRIHLAQAGANDQEVVAFFEKLATLRMPDGPVEHESYRVIRSWLVKSRPLVRDGGTQFPRMMSVYQVLITMFNRVNRGEAVGRIRVSDDAKVVKFFDELVSPE